jgi:hypothetical protein
LGGSGLRERPLLRGEGDRPSVHSRDGPLVGGEGGRGRLRQGPLRAWEGHQVVGLEAGVFSGARTRHGAHDGRVPLGRGWLRVHRKWGFDHVRVLKTQNHQPALRYIREENSKALSSMRSNQTCVISSTGCSRFTVQWSALEKVNALIF